MEPFFTPFAIILATVGAYAVGALWYSPILFLTPWLKGNGLTKETAPKRSTAYIIRNGIYSFVAHGCIVAVIALLFDLLQITELKTALSLSLLLTFGFIVSTKYIDLVYTLHGTDYEKKNQISFLIASGYYLTVSLVVSVILFGVTR